MKKYLIFTLFTLICSESNGQNFPNWVKDEVINNFLCYIGTTISQPVQYEKIRVPKMVLPPGYIHTCQIQSLDDSLQVLRDDGIELYGVSDLGFAIKYTKSDSTEKVYPEWLFKGLGESKPLPTALIGFDHRRNTVIYISGPFIKHDVSYLILIGELDPNKIKKWITLKWYFEGVQDLRVTENEEGKMYGYSFTDNSGVSMTGLVYQDSTSNKIVWYRNGEYSVF
ncbi:hypothetical protein [Croceimicrobium hydrocarbonivorans]|uniref:Uncharacterized protein n=1 Tax=Croceimicrobium hydrocarbonivorans TaxID=2761580 RepID=A0A7H0VIE5_9FLAO|nr:hypothetical protein [Croceimicrobium hydrocarbonivorans]QNR25493.1 hypothetical protein H4K34_06540 [Croceimicrobium hydrocarbonivorans]